MKYKVLFFDLDNTLLDFYKAEKSAVRLVLKQFSLPFDDTAVSTYSAINKSYWERFEKGEIKKDEIFEGRFHTFLDHYGLTADVPAIAKQYFKNLAEGYFTVTGATEILEYLKKKGYLIYATTNGVSFTQFNRIEHSGLKPYFDGVFVSEEVGFQKPKREYFEYAINHIKPCQRSEILVIGDSQSSDILGGINAELDTCWFNFENKQRIYKSTYEIKKLSDLKNIL